MADNLAALVRSFEESEQVSVNSRRDGEQARDYYDGNQLTAAERAALKKSRQPIIIENLIRPKIDYLCGLERQTRTDPKAWPRTMQHEADANVATDVLRYICDDQDFAVKRSGVFQNLLVEGYGGVEVAHKPGRDTNDPCVTRIAWERLFFDPHSREHDFSDAHYMGYVTWMDEVEALDRWSDAGDIIRQTFASPTGAHSGSYDDKPKWMFWADQTRKRIRVVTIYTKVKGEWHRCVFTLAGELEPLEPSAYLDEDGKPENPLILQSCYVDRDNDRYGIVRDFISLQDEVNKRRAKYLHMLNSRQVRVSGMAGVTPEKARAELMRPDGIIVGESGDVEDITRRDIEMGHFNLLAEAKQAINSVGPNATMQGKSGQDQSGRAILALQQGGMTEMAPILDSLRHFNVRVYRALWNRVRQLWTEERWTRVTDDPKAARFVGINTTSHNVNAQKIKTALDAGEIDEQTAQQYMQQISAFPPQRANVVAEMDVDIHIEEVADAPALQIEQFEQLVKLAPLAPQNYQPTMFEMLIEASSLRNKDKLQAIMDKAKQGPDPAAQAMQQLQMDGARAEVEKTQSETARNMAMAQKATADAHMGAFQAGAQAA